MDVSRCVLLTFKRDGVEKRASGLHVRSGVILTAAHVLGGNEYRIWMDGHEYKVDRVIWSSPEKSVDIALLSCDSLPEIDPVPLALVDRTQDHTLDHCRCVGFSNLKHTLTGSQSTNQVHVLRGTIHLAEDLDVKHPGGHPRVTMNLDESTTMSLSVAAGFDASDDAPNASPAAVASVRRLWAGMSGAAVRVADQQEYCVGVVTSWEPRAHARALSVTPLSSIQTLPTASANLFWSALDVRADDLPVLPSRNGGIPTVPRLRDSPVPRPELVDRICEQLFGENAIVGVTASLFGTGGFGKTVLAQMVAHDRRVRSSFRTLLWLSIGQEALGAALAGVISDAGYSVGQLRSGLRDPIMAAADFLRRLPPGNCLIILDDVWYYAQIEPFISHGPNVTVLVTTRNAHCLPTETPIVEVGPMTEDQATRALLRRVSIAGATARTPELISAVLEKSGRWPVLLGLLSASLGFGSRLQHIDETLEQHLLALNELGPVALDIMSEDGRDRAVGATLAISFQTLSAHETQLLRGLAVLPEDVDLPLEILVRLWKFDGILPAQVIGLREKLIARALILPGLSPGSIRLHDIIRSYLRHDLGPELVDHAKRFCAAVELTSEGVLGKSWQNLPSEEKYAWEWSAWHAAEASYHEVVLGMLQHPEYVVNKLAAVGIQSLEADLSLPGATGQYASHLRSAMGRTQHILAPSMSRSTFANSLLIRLTDYPTLDVLVPTLRRWLTAGLELRAATDLPDVASPSLIRMFPHPAPVTRVTVNANQGWFLTADSKGTGRFWSLPEGRLMRSVFPVSRRIACSRSGNWAATCDGAGTIRVWGPFSATPIMTLNHIDGRIEGIAALESDPNALLVVSSSGLSKWRIGDPPTLLGSTNGAQWWGETHLSRWGRELRVVSQGSHGGFSFVSSYPTMGPQGGFSGLGLVVGDTDYPDWEVSPSGKSSIYYGSGYSIRRSGSPDFSFPELVMPLSAACFSYDDDVIAVGRPDGGIQVSRRSEYSTTHINAHWSGVNDIEMIPGSTQFISAGQDGMAALWDWSVTSERGSKDTSVGRVLRVAGDAEGKRILVLTAGGLSVLDLWSNVKVAEFVGGTEWTQQGERLTMRLVGSKAIYALPRNLMVRGPKWLGVGAPKDWARVMIHEHVSFGFRDYDIRVILNEEAIEVWRTVEQPDVRAMGRSEFHCIELLGRVEVEDGARIAKLSGNPWEKKLVALTVEGDLVVLKQREDFSLLGPWFEKVHTVHCGLEAASVVSLELVEPDYCLINTTTGAHVIRFDATQAESRSRSSWISFSNDGASERSIDGRGVLGGRTLAISGGVLSIKDSRTGREVAGVSFADVLTAVYASPQGRIVCGGGWGLYLLDLVQE